MTSPWSVDIGDDTTSSRPSSDSWRHYPPLDLPPLLRAALDQMTERGYEGTSVRSIAQAVGVTVPALYYHFENKQALLVALLDHAMDILLTHVDAAVEQAGPDPRRRLRALVEATALYVVHHGDLAMLDLEIRSLTPENRERHATARNRLVRQLRQIIEAGVAEGLFRTAHPRECTRAILTMCQGLAGWYDLHGRIPPQEVAQQYALIALAAVGDAGNPAPRPPDGSLPTASGAPSP